MTREEMIAAIEEECNRISSCSLCPLYDCGDCYSSDLTYEEAKSNYDNMFPTPKTGKEKTPQVKDSGARTVFETGAVRDIQEDKGRCDLLPLDVVASLALKFDEIYEEADVLRAIATFMQTGDKWKLLDALKKFCSVREWSLSECILEVSMHYKQGAEKYGERNWEKGILLHSYIDSGVRHFLKYIDGRTDERHDRAFVWNMLGAIWTMENKEGTDLIDIPFDLLSGNRKYEEITNPAAEHFQKRFEEVI